MNCIKYCTVVEESCRDTACEYIGACLNREALKIEGFSTATSADEVEQDDDVLTGEYDESGFQTAFEEEEFSESLSDDEEDEADTDDDPLNVSPAELVRSSKALLKDLKEKSEAASLAERLDKLSL